jgi:hypothetical protein
MASGIAKKIAIVVVIGRNFNAKKLNVVLPKRAIARMNCNFGLFETNWFNPLRGIKSKINTRNAPQYLAKITCTAGSPYKISHLAELSITVNRKTATNIKITATIGLSSRAAAMTILYSFALSFSD